MFKKVVQFESEILPKPSIFFFALLTLPFAAAKSSCPILDKKKRHVSLAFAHLSTLELADTFRCKLARAAVVQIG